LDGRSQLEAEAAELGRTGDDVNRLDNLAAQGKHQHAG
jgi:hypothetical protein